MSKLVVRVRFMDASVKAFAIDQEDHVDELLQTVSSKLELKEHGNFALFEAKDDWERCLDLTESPAEVMKGWEAGGKDKEGSYFLFKKRIFGRDDAKELMDPIAKHYNYLQALANVINGEYPCTVEEAIRLAGLQVQIVYGDHNHDTHCSGFLASNLDKFIPKTLMGQKKPAEWEQVVFKEHRTHIGVSSELAKTQYLNQVKKWEFYGTTFFPIAKLVANSKKIKSGKYIIGVNCDGILLLKPKDRSLISKHPFTEICSWASSSSTFAFEFGSQNDATKYTFETKHGVNIAATIQTYIDILVQMLTYGEVDDDESFTGTYSDED